MERPRPNPRLRPDNLSDAVTRVSIRGMAMAATAALVLSACQTPPPPPAYQRPAVEVPDRYAESELFKRADPQAAAVPQAWWALFGDPELDALQQRVPLNNQNLQASVAQWRIAQAALAQARASLSPTLGVNTQISRSDNPGAAAPATVYSLGLAASWEVDLFGRLGSALDAAQARVQASAADLAAVRLSLHASVAQTYLALRAAEAQAQVIERSIAAFARSLELTRNRYDAGVVSAADVGQAQTQLKSAEVQLIESRQTRAQLAHALAALCGQSAASLSLAANGRMPDVPAVPEQLPADLLQRRPDIAAAERRVAAAHAQIGVARGAYFPSLNLSASLGVRQAGWRDLLSLPNLFWSLGPALAQSLLDGGARQAAEASAFASVELATAQYRQTVLTAMQEVEDNLSAAAWIEQSIAAQQEALSAAQRVLTIANNQYLAGTVSYLNVVTAQSSVLTAERNLIDLRSRRLTAVNQLLKNIAGDWRGTMASRADDGIVPLRPRRDAAARTALEQEQRIVD